MRIILHEVTGGSFALDANADRRWHLKRADAIEAAITAGDGDYAISEHYCEGESYAECVLAALRGSMRAGPVLSPVRVENGEATYQEPRTVTRKVTARL